MSDALAGLPMFGVRVTAESDGRGEHPAGAKAELLVLIKAPDLEQARSRTGALLFHKTEWRHVTIIDASPVRDRVLLPPWAMPSVEAAERGGFAYTVFLSGASEA